MSGYDQAIGGKRVEPVPYGLRDLRGVSSGQICAANASAKQSVAREQQGPAVVVGLKTHRAWGVTGRVHHNGLAFAELDSLSIGDVAIDGQGLSRFPPEHGRLHREAVIEKHIVLVEADLAPVLLFDIPGAVNVVEVRMGMDQRFHAEVVVLDDLPDLFRIAPGIDDHCLFGVAAGQDSAVAFEGAYREGFAK